MKKTIFTIVLTALCASALTSGIFLSKNNDTPPVEAHSVSTTQVTQAATDTTAPPSTTEQTAPTTTTTAPTAVQTTAKTTVPSTAPTTAVQKTTAVKATSPTTTAAPVTTTAAATTKAASQSRISSEKALEAALSHAGLSASQVREKEVELDKEKGTLVYDISFEKAGTDYEYIIDAQSGKILYSEKEPPKQVTTSKSSSASEKKISAEKAFEIALKHAGLSTSEIREKEIESDKEKGISVYEVSFEKNGTDYEYIINAQSGEIIHTEKERN